jgi:hypothetical protein
LQYQQRKVSENKIKEEKKSRGKIKYNEIEKKCNKMIR